MNAETALLGSLLTNNAAFWQVADKVTAQDFTAGTDRALFLAIADGIKAGKPVDPFTLAESHGEEMGQYALPIWSTGLPSNAAAYADAVRRQGEARRLRSAGQRIASCGTFEEAQALLAEVRPAQLAMVKSIKDGLTEMALALQRRYDAGGEVSGVPTSLASLDALTSGWQPGNLIIVAARPGMGKSAFALQAALAAGRTFYASLEMTAGELTERAVSNVGGIPHRWLRFPLDAPDHASELVLTTSGTLSKYPLMIDDTAGLSADATFSRIRQAHMADPLRLAVIDHLGLFERPGKHDPSELGLITSGAKRLAKDLGIPVILLCQLNRGLESRNDKRPTLADLRDSGRIEEDADVVIGLYRDEYYHPNGPLAGYLEAIVLKNRSGEKGTAWAKSLLSMMRLESTDEPERPAEPAETNVRNGGFQAGKRTGAGSRYQPGVDRNHG
jgi:replicative DNA helicase